MAVGNPGHYESDSRGLRVLDRLIHQEAGAVPVDREVARPGVWRPRWRLNPGAKEQPRKARPKRESGCHFNAHQIALQVRIEELPPVAPPLRLPAATGRYHPLPLAARKIAHVYLSPARFVRSVGYPVGIVTAIGREACAGNAVAA